MMAGSIRAYAVTQVVRIHAYAQPLNYKLWMGECMYSDKPQVYACILTAATVCMLTVFITIIRAYACSLTNYRRMCIF